jgi:hypothetical protein
MNTWADSSYQCWTTYCKLRAAQWPIGAKAALAAFLFAGMSLPGFGQSFDNLDFEQATLVPVSGGYAGEVQIGPALPGWSVFIQEPFVLYDNMFLDSAGVSIFDTLMGAKAFQGNFTVILQGGFSLYSGPPDRLSSAIAQTGVIPAWAKTLLFDAWVMDPAFFTVSLGPFYVLASYTNYNLYAVDVSGVSGQTVGLAFTALPRPPPGLAINNVYLDDIRFSSSLLSAPPLILTPPLSQTVSAGYSVEFTVVVAATGSPAPAYQWFFNGTNAITGATNADLQLANLQLSQSGTYTVVVTNTFGAVTSPAATLTVIGMPPTVVVPPLDQTAGIGASADFTVSAAGSRPLMYQWSFDGRPISGASSSDLYLANLQPLEAGTYAVTVTNAFGAVTSSPAMLTVTGVAQTNRLAGTVVGWGYDYFGESTVPASLSGAVAIAAGEGHSLALQSDGTVVAWGDNRLGQSAIPISLRGVIAIAAGASHSLALKSGGTVVACGLNSYGESTVPPNLTGVTAIAAGGYHSLGLKSDGTVVAWGRDYEGQSTVPAGLRNVSAIAAGTYHSLALKSDGTVVGWGYDFEGQSAVPAGLRGVVAIAAGGLHSLALKSDGTVVGWGYNYYGQVTIPPSLTNVIAIAAGGFGVGLGGHSLALKSDGTVTGWGDDSQGQTNVPASLTGVIAIAAGGWHSLAITAKPIVQTPPGNQTAELGSTVRFRVCATGYAPLIHQWFFNGTNIISDATTNSCLDLTNIEPTQAGAYIVVVSNAYGAVTSAPAMLSVIPAVERRTVPALTLLGQPGSSLNLQDAEALGPSPNWVAFDNVALTNTFQWYFDLSAPLPPQRFYRAWQPSPSSVVPALDLHMVPALTLTGTVGSSVRVDCINQFGPIDAWVTLDTVSLTNTSELYFDVSTIGQPPRLWRLVPVP